MFTINPIVSLPIGLRDDEIIARYHKEEVEAIKRSEREVQIQKYVMVFTDRIFYALGPNYVTVLRELIRYWAERYVDEGIEPTIPEIGEIIELRDGTD